MTGVAARLLDFLGRPDAIAGHPITLGASLGVSIAGSDGGDTLSVLHAADLALVQETGLSAPSTSPLPTGSMTGLLVGRRMLVLMNIEMAFEDLGCSAIHAAASVAEALDVLGRHGFDAALIDVNLGGEKSYPVADALARLRIPFVFSTGYSDHGDRPDLADRPVLRKPYTRAALIAVLERLLPEQPLPVAA